MRPSVITLAALLLAPLTAIDAAAPPAATKPSLVHLLADQWRASATGYAGDPNVKMPNLEFVKL